MLKNIKFQFLISFFLFLIFSVALFNKSTIQEFAHSYKWLFLYLCFPAILFSNKIKISRVNGICIFLLGIFISSIIISTLTSDYLDTNGLIYLLGYITLFLLAAYFPFSLSREKNSTYLFYGIYLTSLICLLFSVLLILSSSAWGNGRFSGVFHNPNTLGAISTLCAICSFVLFIRTKKKLYLFFYILAVSILLLVQSRSAYLAFALITIFISVKKYKFTAVMYLLVIIASITILSKMVSMFQNESFSTRDIKLHVDASRQNIFSKHIELFLEKPIFGQGLSEGEGGSGGRFPAELAYTDILSFSGIIGSAGFFIAILLALYLGYQSLIDKKVEVEGSFYLFAAILIMSIGDGYISNIGNPLPIFAWLYLGTVYRLK